MYSHRSFVPVPVHSRWVRLNTRTYNKPSIYPFFLAELALLIKNLYSQATTRTDLRSSCAAAAAAGAAAARRNPIQSGFCLSLSLSLSRIKLRNNSSKGSDSNVGSVREKR